jgi:hypothetical protein
LYSSWTKINNKNLSQLVQGCITLQAFKIRLYNW